MCRITSLRFACSHKVNTTDEECPLKHRFPLDQHFVTKCDINKSTECPDCQNAKLREEAARVREDFRKNVEQEAAKARELAFQYAQEEEAKALEEEMKRIKEAAALFYSVTSALEGGPTFTQSKCIFECCYEKPKVKTPAIEGVAKLPNDFAQTKTEVVPVPSLSRVKLAGIEKILMECF